MDDKFAEELIQILERAINVEVYESGDEPNYFTCSYCIEDNMECKAEDGGINHATWCKAKNLYDKLVEQHPDLDPKKNRCIGCSRPLIFVDRPGPGYCFNCRTERWEKTNGPKEQQ